MLQSVGEPPEYTFEFKLLLDNEEEIGPVPILFDNTMCVQLDPKIPRDQTHAKTPSEAR